MSCPFFIACLNATFCVPPYPRLFSFLISTRLFIPFFVLYNLTTSEVLSKEPSSTTRTVAFSRSKSGISSMTFTIVLSQLYAGINMHIFMLVESFIFKFFWLSFLYFVSIWKRCEYFQDVENLIHQVGKNCPVK